ncbi:dna polymerase a [Lucifera butyrica]|uniref:DNA polymerase I n=1 Tax=Lucifera butyrica TaxID=1351585 RepID=A0A498RBB1_9FIRM|nr:DNA polymerase I [Lucifera butyrica]VBB08751.1 dna polymerase a [Lucifera butyrica]
MSRTFVIIDGSSLVHRAFYALPVLTTTSGRYTNAVYGFTTMLMKLLDDIKPDAVAIAFDKGRTTFRTELYADYKAHRKATPAELSEQFPLVQEVVQAFGITVLEKEGFEGDDIIGTLAQKAAGWGYEALIVTGDRDALQLIDAKVKVMLTKKGISEMDVMDCKAVQAKYGVTPKQIIDLKGLMGDASDNIPGVPGIGEKTAGKLIAQFGSIENLINHIEQVAGKKLQENLYNHTELAILSKKLATIDCAMELDFLPETFCYNPDGTRLRELFTRLEFKGLLMRVNALLPQGDCEADKPGICLPPMTVLTAEEAVDGAVSEIIRTGSVELYPVVTGRIPELQLAGIVCWLSAGPVYAAANVPGWEKIVSLLADSATKKVTHDVKSLYNYGWSKGIKINNVVFDTMLAAYLLEPTAAEYQFDRLMDKYLQKQLTWPAVTDPAEYGAAAIFAIHELYPPLGECLSQSELDTLYFQVELPLAGVLAAVESTGIKVDAAHLKAMSGEFAAKIEELLQAIYIHAGEQFNVNSTKQLGQILFDKIKLKAVKKTKTGYSTDAEVLEKLAGQHPIIDKLLEYRLLMKLKSTYLDGLSALIHPVTGRIHTTFNQTVTATGRLSSSDPNLQNIPIRTEMGRRIRELFVPGDGWDYLVAADYSQIELRILAHISQDRNLTEAFLHNQDIHTRTAAEVFGVPMEMVTGEMRSRAKAVNFGIVYGISDYGLSRDIGVSRKEAGEYIQSYFAKYQGVKNYIDTVVREARHQGYVTTLFGRRRNLPDINSSNFNQRSFAERTAMNTPIQGTAADIIKKAMLDVAQTLAAQKLRSRILLQVHDELVLEVAAEELALVSELVKTAMEQTVQLTVPLLVDVKVGRNWAEAK